MTDNNEHDHTSGESLSVKDAIREEIRVQRAGGVNDAILEGLRDEIEAALDAGVTMTALHRVLRRAGEYGGSLQHFRGWLDRQGLRRNMGLSPALQVAQAARAAKRRKACAQDCAHTSAPAPAEPATPPVEVAPPAPDPAPAAPAPAPEPAPEEPVQAPLTAEDLGIEPAPAPAPEAWDEVAPAPEPVPRVLNAGETKPHCPACGIVLDDVPAIPGLYYCKRCRKQWRSSQAVWR